MAAIDLPAPIWFKSMAKALKVDPYKFAFSRALITKLDERSLPFNSFNFMFLISNWYYNVSIADVIILLDMGIAPKI
jgi:hypothetical protein